MEFALTPKQQEAQNVAASDATHVLLEGGSRSGKTFLHIRNIVFRALKAPGSRHAILRYRLSHIRSAIMFDTFPRVMAAAFDGVPWHMNKSDMFATIGNKSDSSEIWLGGLDDKERTEKILGNEYCVSPDTRVLMADLTWSRAQDVRKGDEIIAFPESLDGHMKLIRATVSFNKQLHKRRYRVVTNKGEIVVSESHKFVTYHDDRRHRNFRPLSWRTVEQLQPGDKLRFAVEPWASDRSFDGGWLSGLFDGEGWISRESGAVGVAQNEGFVLDRAKELMKSRGHDVRFHATSKCKHIVATGLWQAMRIIGSLRPVRLMAKSHLLWEGRNGFNGRSSAAGSMSRHSIKTEARHVAEILSIEEIDAGEVRAIQTTSKTLITDGFLSHNCTILLNEASQISWHARNTVLTRLAQRCMTKIEGRSPSPLKTRMLYDCNPPNKNHWLFKVFHKRVDPETNLPLVDPKNYASFQMNPRDNTQNLDADYLKILEAMPARMRKRFLDGEYADANPNQLFAQESIDKWRVLDGAVPDMVRVVVAVDPSGSSDTDNADNDAIGIVVCGLGVDGNCYLLEDCTVKAGPATWGNVATTAFDRRKANTIVAEMNFGGAMVKHVIDTARPRTPFMPVTASRGKHVRADPVAALYEQGRVRHVGYFPELEDELSGFTTMGYVGDGSPNRADAAVWAVSALFPSIIERQTMPTVVQPIPVAGQWGRRAA